MDWKTRLKSKMKKVPQKTYQRISQYCALRYKRNVAHIEMYLGTPRQSLQANKVC